MNDEKQSEPNGSGRSGRRWLVWLLLMLVAAGGAGMGYWFFVRPGDAETVEARTPEPGPRYEVGALTTNLHEGAGRAYIQVGATLEVDDPKTAAALDQRAEAVRDAIIGILRAKQYAEVEGADGMDAVAAEIRAAVNALLPQGTVRAVFFTEFIIQ